MFLRNFLYLFSLFAVFSQQLSSQSQDSLSDKSFDELHRLCKTLAEQNNNQKVLLYFEAYKQKAIRENNPEKLVNGYRSMANWQTSFERKIAYADSAIHIAHTTIDDKVISNALFTKGLAYYTNNEWDKALEYYLLADKHLSKINDTYAEHKIKYVIFQAKYTLGNYEEALPVIQECIAYFKQFSDSNHRKGYLNSLHALGLCLNRMGDYEECSQINNKGLEKAEEFDLNEIKYLFSSSEGVNQYYLGNYNQALELLEYSLPFVVSSGKTKQEIVNRFFMGKSYLELNRNKTAIACFEKVDSLFSETGYLRDDMAENYVFLISDAQKQNNLEKELYYTNRLLEADKMLHNQYKDIAVTVHKKYDTKKLQESKVHIEKLLGQKTVSNNWLTLSLLIAFTIILLLSIRYAYYKKRFKKLYQQFVDSLPTPSNTTTSNSPVEYISTNFRQEIKEDVKYKIFKKLKRFENNKGFTKQNLTLTKLAENLDTNPKYLSQIIMEYKQKDYIQYLNDLRFNHLKELLKTKKYLEYTIEALAKEIGFSSAKGFNMAFYKATGMKFSNFLNEFRKDKQSEFEKFEISNHIGSVQNLK